jgi:poly(A) polymerase
MKQRAADYPCLGEAIIQPLLSAGFFVHLHGFSAIDRYMGRDTLPFVFFRTDAGLSDLARLFEGLRFPGAALADAALETGAEAGAASVFQRTCYFRCLDRDDTERDLVSPSFKLLSFFENCENRHFRDPQGVYPLLKYMRDGSGQGLHELWLAGLNIKAERRRALADAALILARYSPGVREESELRPKFFRDIAEAAAPLSAGITFREEEQRVLLTGLLASPHPDFGLELLKTAGFIDEFWPELAELDNVDHSKEFHPEGNVWKHTLETFRYRKPVQGSYDLRLSLGLLLHDTGKPLSESSGNRRFDGHAELGARRARRFLERLGFERNLTEDIFYLVKNHMLPAALPRLPLARTEEILHSPLFPVLLELYRCDESSSFKGLTGYYESSATYQSYLKHRRNPYRSPDGKKLNRGGIVK